MSLYIVPTPVGNLGDITRRAVEILKEVDFIIAEDTRHSRKLLSHLGISKQLVSHYRPREAVQTEKILPRLSREKAALITDSGTPGISDPGSLLIRRALDAGVEIIPLPGPTAFVPALIASGIEADRFLFLGFSPRKKGDQIAFFRLLSSFPYTLVFYESPRRMETFLENALHVFGNRRFTLAREISKINETFHRGRLHDWKSALQNEMIAGEMTVVIEGLKKSPEPKLPDLKNLEDLFAYFKDKYGFSRNRLKKILMKK